MLNDIQGLHHVTSLAEDANINNQFFTNVLGLRRIKKTVNFDRPDVYHLYYGDEVGTPGSVMTYFPFPGMARGVQGTGEVGTTVFAVPPGAIGYWENRLADFDAGELKRADRFGEDRLEFVGPDGDGFALVEAEDERAPWCGVEVPDDVAIRGFHSVSMRLSDGGAMSELLQFMNYEKLDEHDGITRLDVSNGGAASVVDLEILPGAKTNEQGAGSVHHVAFAVEDQAAQLRARKALIDTGYSVTPVIDRDYFWAIYFKTPDGILFEIATNEPGFDRDEARGELGAALKLPSQHEHLREKLNESLIPIED